jgi:hypothetical protein
MTYCIDNKLKLDDKLIDLSVYDGRNELDKFLLNALKEIHTHSGQSSFSGDRRLLSNQLLWDLLNNLRWTDFLGGQSKETGQLLQETDSVAIFRSLQHRLDGNLAYYSERIREGLPLYKIENGEPTLCKQNDPEVAQFLNTFDLLEDGNCATNIFDENWAHTIYFKESEVKMLNMFYGEADNEDELEVRKIAYQLLLEGKLNLSHNSHINNKKSREAPSESRKSRNAMLRLIKALSALAIGGLTNQQSTNAASVIAALESGKITPPLKERALQNYLDEADRLEK